MNCDIPNNKTTMPIDDASTCVNSIFTNFTDKLKHLVGQNWNSINTDDTTVVSKDKVCRKETLLYKV